MSQDHVLSLLAAALAGFGFGLAYFTMVRKTAALLAARCGWRKPLMLFLGRMAAAIVFLVVMAKLGAPVLIAAFLGFLLARHMQLDSVKRAVP